MTRLNNIYVVVCNGISDIGKGWLTASILGLDPENTLPIKIDPLLNLSFPAHLGVPIRELSSDEDVLSFAQKRGLDLASEPKISEDFQTYKEAGAKVYPECNIIAGELINRFLNSPIPQIRAGEVKKRTLADLSRYLAEEITQIVKSRNPSKVIIEVGGTIEDHESIYIPGTMRFLAHPEYLGVAPEIILLTFFEFAEAYAVTRYRVKTQYIRRGIMQVSQIYYNLALKACFVRRRNVPEDVPDSVLLSDLKNAAYEAQLPKEKVVYIPNVSQGSLKGNLGQITNLIRQSGVFGTETT